MKNKTMFVRNKGKSYTIVPNHILNDDRLSSYAKIIMITIISNADDWIINRKEIQKRVNITHCKFEEGWELLKSLGYIEVIRRQGYFHYIINELPLSITTGSNCETSTSEPRSSINTGRNCKGSNLINTNINKVETQDLSLKGEGFDLYLALNPKESLLNEGKPSLTRLLSEDTSKGTLKPILSYENTFVEYDVSGSTPYKLDSYFKSI